MDGDTQEQVTVVAQQSLAGVQRAADPTVLEVRVSGVVWELAACFSPFTAWPGQPLTDRYLRK